MGNFTGAISALMQNACDFINSNLNKAAAFIHAGPCTGKCYKFPFFDK